MTQALRVALWIPTVDPAEVGDNVVTTSAPNPQKAIGTKFQLGGSGGGGSGVEEAPNDGFQYARQSLGWSPITVGGGGITDAPLDGRPYLRVSGAWAPYDIIDGGVF